MHVLFVNKVAPDLGGGAEARIQEVGRRMVATGHRVTVVCGTTAPGLPSRTELDGMDVRFVRTMPDPLLQRSRVTFTPSRVFFYFHPQTLHALRRVHAEHPVDVICDDISPFPTPAASQFARELGIPAIGVVHNLGGQWRTWRHSYGLVSGTAGYYAEQWLRTAQPYQHIISDSAWMVDALATSIPHERLCWIPNGVDSTQFCPASPESAKSACTHIGYAGRFVTLKGHKILVDATAQALAAGANIHLHLAGDGPHVEDVKHQIERMGITDVVTLHGRVPRAAMPSFYRNLDIYVSPSYVEGLPVTFLEAMASGLPIISTRIDATRGIITAENGLLTEVASAPDMALAVIALASNRDRCIAMGRYARHEAETKYNWDNIAAEQTAVYTRYLQPA